MAKIVVLGNRGIIKSEIKLEDLRLVKSFSAESLKLKDENGQTEFVFDISGNDGNGYINTYGVAFAKQPYRETELAYAELPELEGEVTVENLGLAFGNYLIRLIELEQQVIEAIEEARHTRESIHNSIELI